MEKAADGERWKQGTGGHYSGGRGNHRGLPFISFLEDSERWRKSDKVVNAFCVFARLHVAERVCVCARY